MSIKRRHWTLLALFLGMNVSVALLFLFSSKRVAKYHETAALWSRHAVLIGELAVGVYQYKDGVLRYLRSPDDGRRRGLESLSELINEKMRFSLGLAGHFSAEEIEEEKKMHEAVGRILGRGTEILARQARGAPPPDPTELERLVNEVFYPAARERIREEQEGVISWQARALKANKRALMCQGLLMSFAVLTGFFLISRLSGYIIDSLAEIGRGARMISSGDFQHRLAFRRPADEFGDLALQFNRMAEDLLAKEKSIRDFHERSLQSEKMSALGRLAAGMAHEINNPLGVILGFAQAAVRKVQPGDPLRMPLESIEREALRCKNLVQYLLTFSRTSKPETSPLDLNRSVEEALVLVQAGIKNGSIAIEKKLAPGLPAILGNRQQIEQALINLASNAADAMPQGGTLEFATELEDGPAHPWICLKVSDTGEGIPPEIKSKIFEPFFTTKPIGQGTGLGLGIVYDIVKKHSGTIEVESRPGFTQFRIKFPPQARPST